MKKLVAMLFAAVVLLAGTPQVDAAYHLMARDSYGYKYLLDDSSIEPLSKRKVEFSLHIDRAGDVYVERVYIHKVDGMWMYQANDGLDRLCRGTDWARNSLQWLFHNGYLID